MYADKNNFIICASAGKPNLSSKDYSDSGVISDHAYAVISVKEVEHPIDGKVKLLQLRNPWGHKEWMGSWSDKSDKWTPELKQALNVKDVDDGIFYISYNDYMCYYRSTTICKVMNDYNYKSLRV